MVAIELPEINISIFVLQTQMQSIKTVHYDGLKDAFVTIMHKEGPRRLLRGMSAMVLGAGPAHAMYFSCYEKVKHKLTVKMTGKSSNSSAANGMYFFFFTTVAYCLDHIFRILF